MTIHQAALDRLRDAKIGGQGMAAVLQQMAVGVEMFGAAASELQLDWQKADDKVRDGDLMPGVTLSLRPAVVSPEGASS